MKKVSTISSPETIKSDEKTREALLSIISQEGSISATGRAIGVRYLTVHRWVNGDCSISPAYARIIQMATNLKPGRT